MPRATSSLANCPTTSSRALFACGQATAFSWAGGVVSVAGRARSLCVLRP
jgi:hypothetical protein